MAKSKGPSKHSRAARRATSPSINTDQSLKETSLPRDSKDSVTRPSVLAAHRSAGVSKKTRPLRKTRMTTKMRKRHERGLEMAEAVTERTGKKIEKSIGRARSVQKRSRTWEDINKDAAVEEVEQTAGRFGALMEGDEEEEDDVEVEDANPEAEADGFNPANPAASKARVEAEDDDDEIL